MRHIFFLLFSSLLFSLQLPQSALSTPEEVATLSADEEALIGGIVSPISGQPVLKITDLTARGAQGISVQRVYVSPYIVHPVVTGHDYQDFCNRMQSAFSLADRYRGWSLISHVCMRVAGDCVRYVDPSGIALDLSLASGRVLAPVHGGNTCGDLPSGKYDLRNIRLIREQDRVVVFAPDGTRRQYGYLWVNGELLYLLEKETLPNGKILRYAYDASSLTIRSLDPLERYVYATVRIQGERLPESVVANGVSVTYRSEVLFNRSEKLQKKKKDKEFRPKNLSYTRTMPPLIVGVSSPSYRQETARYNRDLQLTSFSGKEDAFVLEYAGSPSRVAKLFLPVGEGNAWVDVYTVAYEAGRTVATRKDGSRVEYLFNPELQLLEVRYVGPNGKLQKEKRLEWESSGWLKRIFWKDGAGRVLWERIYADYDAFGNSGKEIFRGDLTGSGEETSYEIRRRFSQDGFNLLLREEHDDGLVVVYTYLPGTNLVKTQCTQEKDRVLFREEYEYDDRYNLIRKVIDDGKEQRITRYTLRQEGPFLHMPEWVEKSCSSGLIQKTKYAYDKYGNVCQEDVYGSDGMFAYSVFREYDEQGNELSETNALGLKAKYAYSPKGLMQESDNFSGRLKGKREYDAANRLRKKVEIGKGQTHTSLYDYDCLSRLQKETDDFGNATFYKEYDATDQPTCVKFPSVSSVEAEVPVVKRQSHDPFGRVLTQTDANGHTTSYKYNAYGSPTEKVYPNGAKEMFLYFPNGKLRSHTDRQSLVTEYSYDVLDRVTEKQYIFNGQFLTQETWTYSAFHLLSFTDKENRLTIYTYDPAGRKIREECAGRTIAYNYDPLGRMSKEICYNGDATLYVHRDYDFLGQVLEERKTDAAGHLLFKIGYSYDADGNGTSVTRYPHNQPATIFFSYDPFGRLVEMKDALGFLTTTVYDESRFNSLKQRVLTKKITDPNGIVTEIGYDAFGREVYRQTAVLRFEHRSYDAVGNLVQVREGHRLTRYTYNALDLPETLTRAFDTPDARTTSYTYTPSGLLKTKQLPSGIVLTYTYDVFGYPVTLSSSNRAISQIFRHNHRGALVHASDSRHTIDRILDPFDNILMETVDGKYTLAKTYDAFDRLLTLTLPDRLSIQYTYDPLYLRKVETPFGSHTYNTYDFNGNLLSEILPYNLSEQTYTYDRNGRLHAFISPYFAQTLSYDPAGRIEHISSEGSFAYDALSQLIAESNHTYAHDTRYNRIAKDNAAFNHNDLDEFDSKSYDRNGNLIEKDGFALSYDPLNRLVQAQSDTQLLTFTYDPLGRRLSKTANGKTELSLYDGLEEIVALAENRQDVRILGLHQRPVFLTLQNQPFVPICDFHGNIRRLIDPATRSVAQSLDYTAFGEEMAPIQKPFNPWRYSAKRFDTELGLSYFGERYYDAAQGRWITTDPMGFADGMNLYAYVLNNPLSYRDPYGKSIGGYLLGVGEILLGGTLVLSGGILEVATFGGYTLGFGIQEAVGLSLIGHGAFLMTTQAQEIDVGGKDFSPTPNWRDTQNSFSDQVWKNDNKSGANQNHDHKKPKPNISGKDGSKDAPSWAKGKKPYANESGKKFAERLLDEKYGQGNYQKGPDTEFNKIQKWGDRSWE